MIFREIIGSGAVHTAEAPVNQLINRRFLFIVLRLCCKFDFHGSTLKPEGFCFYA